MSQSLKRPLSLKSRRASTVNYRSRIGLVNNVTIQSPIPTSNSVSQRISIRDNGLPSTEIYRTKSIPTIMRDDIHNPQNLRNLAYTNILPIEDRVIANTTSRVTKLTTRVLPARVVSSRKLKTIRTENITKSLRTVVKPSSGVKKFQSSSGTRVIEERSLKRSKIIPVVKKDIKLMKKMDL